MTHRFLLYLVLFCGAALSGQNKTSGLHNLQEQYKRSASIPDKVEILLKMDSIYVFRMADIRSVLDSALLLSRQAQHLSRLIKYKGGYDRATLLMGSALMDKKDIQSAIILKDRAKGPLKIQLLIALGEHYLFRPGGLSQNIDSSYVYIHDALHRSRSLHSRTLENESLGLLGKYYFLRGNMRKGMQCFLAVIEFYHSTGDQKKEAKWWQELGTYTPNIRSTYSHKIGFYRKALTLYKNTNQQSEIPSIIEDIGSVQQRNNDLVRAEINYLKALEIRKSLHKNLYVNYLLLTRLYKQKAEYPKMLQYALVGVRQVDLAGEKYTAALYYFELAEAYRELGETNRSLLWYKKALDHLMASKEHYLFPIFGRIVDALILQGRIEEALHFMNRFTKENPPTTFLDQEILASAAGEIYYNLGKYDLAEKNYLQMIYFDEKQKEHSQNEIFSLNVGNYKTGAEAYCRIGSFYISTGRYRKAKPYLLKALGYKSTYISASEKKEVHLLLFKIDSAAGNYLSAINHYEIYKHLNDSIFNEKKSKQLAEMQVAYETAEKEKDLVLLRSKDKLQKKELQKSSQSKEYLSAIAAVLLILFMVVFSRYRLKQKSNMQLLAQQKEINVQNAELIGLTTVQRKLLSDKEWLLREIHHRVRNNLQMMISLLNTQSEFLSDPSAIQALRETRERMQTIALIHQKLYQPDTESLIDLASYIEDLVANLEQSFARAETVRFTLDVDRIFLDVSQAVPLGLLINEAVTNSLKYAFIDGKKGAVNISLKNLGTTTVLLNISDDGPGLPKESQFSTSKSFGNQLMELFAEQLDGLLTVENNWGVQISLRFEKIYFTKNRSLSALKI